MSSVARLLLGPVLLYQGRHVRRTLPRLPEPPGDREGTAGSGPPLRLLVVGDSSAAGVGTDSLDEALLGQTVEHLTDRYTVSWRLIARTGAVTSGTLAKLRKEGPQPFDIALTALGVNDITAGRTLGEWLEEQRALVSTLRERFGVRHVVLSGLPPVSEFPALPQPLRWHLGRIARRFDDALKAWAADDDALSYIGLALSGDVPASMRNADTLMASDGFHPGPVVYDAWGERAAAAIAAAAAK